LLATTRNNSLQGAFIEGVQEYFECFVDFGTSSLVKMAAILVAGICVMWC
jgi:hypothetical protein